jgi:hypothetical protein
VIVFVAIVGAVVLLDAAVRTSSEFVKEQLLGFAPMIAACGTWALERYLGMP